MVLVLGIDGGGSSTRAVLATGAGQIVGRGQAGPSNPVSVGVNAAGRAIGEAVSLAWSSCREERRPVDAAVLGIAGLISQDEHVQVAHLAADLRLAERVTVTNDLHIALSGGIGLGPGAVLVAGTGSACYARNVTGGSAVVGGKGWLAGDTGSGYWIAHQALRASVRQWDGRDPAGPLGEAMLEFLGIDGVERLAARLMNGLSPTELARFCPRIIRLAEEGDHSSSRIVLAAMEALAEMAETACGRVGVEAPTVVLAGSLATASQFGPGLATHLMERLPGAEVSHGLLPPIGGAVVEALALVDIAPAPDVLGAVRAGL